MKIEKVLKRDGRIVDFDINKIHQAIYNALCNTKEGTLDDFELQKLANTYAKQTVVVLNSSITSEFPNVESIQDVVESVLIRNNESAAAKHYILYRNDRTKTREMNTSIMNTMKNITFKDSKDVDLKRENANIDGDSAMGTMLRYGSETSKEFVKSFMLRPEIAKAHTEGDIHIHDMDFYNLTATCCQIDLHKLFTDGFSTGHGVIREPNDIITASALTCIAIQANQNDMHGGQSIPALDYYLAPYVKKTYIKHLNRILDTIEAMDKDSIINDIKEYAKQNNTILNEKGIEYIASVLRFYGVHNPLTLAEKALKYTNTSTHQAMEALVHNLNSMQSRAGAQVPFSSINFGTDITEEGRMVSKNLLIATYEGLGEGETPIFPISIFKLKKGVSYEKTDPNYDLFKLACKVSAKRLFPNFSNLDAPFNASAYVEGDIDTEASYMGCVDGAEIITYTINDDLFVEPFNIAYDRIKNINTEISTEKSSYIDCTNIDVSIFDSLNGFTKVKKFIKNPNYNNWKQITFNNGRQLLATSDHPLPVYYKGRTYVKDLCVGDTVPITYKQYSRETNGDLSVGKAWLLGLLLNDTDTSDSIDINTHTDDINTDLLDAIKRYAPESFIGADVRIDLSHDENGYYIVNITSSDMNKINKHLNTFYDNEICRILPNMIFSCNNNIKFAYLAGMLDANGFVNDNTVNLVSTNKSLAIQQMLFIQSLGMPCEIYTNETDSNNVNYILKFVIKSELLNYMHSNKKDDFINICKDTIDIYIEEYASTTVKSIIDSDYDGCSYDVETESDRFDVSGILSHNCRTRVVANNYDKTKQVVTGRGNISFTSINLPRLAIKAEGNVKTFIDMLDSEMELVFTQLLDRLKVQCKKKVRNYPFLMGQNIWIDSEKLSVDDEVGEVLKHGSLTTGFIGLAEALIALIGEHHGESEEAQELGLHIIGYMRDKCDKKSEETGLNFTLIATPAEGLSGRFVKMDKEKFGIIKGVTDKDYYTNSMHIPVYYSINIYDKIRLEAPYHALTNGGHITYVEVDGDPTQNLEAFEDIVRIAHDAGIGYFSINHPIDRDTICGYTGIINDVCPRCGRKDGEGIELSKLIELKKKYSDIKIPYYNTDEDTDKIPHIQI